MIECHVERDSYKLNVNLFVNRSSRPHYYQTNIQVGAPLQGSFQNVLLGDATFLPRLFYLHPALCMTV